MRRIKFRKLTQVIKLTTDRREYHILRCVDQDPYPEEYGYCHDYNIGYSGYRKWKPMWKWQKRMYRTWKHNRKTQWKSS